MFKIVSWASTLFNGVYPFLCFVAGCVATLYSQRIDTGQFSWINQQSPDILKSVFFFYVLVIVGGLLISALNDRLQQETA